MAERAGEAPGHRTDQMPLEPFDRPRHGELVDLGRIHPCVDRSRHQRHAARERRIAGLRHHRGGGQRGHRGLAHRDDVAARSHDPQEADDVVDELVQAEAPLGQRHVARVLPVGDVEVVLRQHHLDCAAQQGGEVAGHRRDQKDARLHDRMVLAEMQQRAERRVVGRFLGHRCCLSVHRHDIDAEGWPVMRETRLGEQGQSGRDLPHQRRRAGAAIGQSRHDCAEPGELTQREQQVRLRLIELIHHRPAVAAFIRLSSGHVRGLYCGAAWAGR